MKTLTLGNLLGKLVLLFAAALAPASAHCGTMTGSIASVTYYIPTPNFVFVYLSNPSTGAPACAAQTSRMTVNLATQAGKALYSHLLALRLTNPAGSVTLVGTGTCTAWSDTEDVLYTHL